MDDEKPLKRHVGVKTILYYGSRLELYFGRKSSLQIRDLL